MRKINLALVEDNIDDQNTFANVVKEYEKNEGVNFNLTIFDSAEKFLAAFKSDYDLIALDIELGKQNGIDLAREIRKKDNSVFIIFETDFAKYALDGYEVNAFDFLIKPIKYEAFKLKVGKIIQVINSTIDGDYLINTSSGVIRTNVSKILYIEVINHTLFFHLQNETIEGRGSLKECEKDLKKYDFVKCNNYLLVNLAKVKGIEKYDCLIGDEKIIISHPKKKYFQDEFMNYLMKKRGV